MIAACQWKFPLCPTQAGYSAQFDEGVISVKLDGGPSFRRLDVAGAPMTVNASWTLTADDYTVFMGLYRDWARSGGDPFYIDLILETGELSEYVASFVPGSVRLTSKNGPGFVVGAQLEVMPQFLDACDDYGTSLAIMRAYYGNDACRAVELVDTAVRTLPAL